MGGRSHAQPRAAPALRLQGETASMASMARTDPWRPCEVSVIQRSGADEFVYVSWFLVYPPGRHPADLCILCVSLLYFPLCLFILSYGITLISDLSFTSFMAAHSFLITAAMFLVSLFYPYLVLLFVWYILTLVFVSCLCVVICCVSYFLLFAASIAAPLTSRFSPLLSRLVFL